MLLIKRLKRYLMRTFFAHPHRYSGEDLCSGSDPLCMICGKPLSDFEKPKAPHESWVIFWVILFLTISPPDAATLINPPRDSIFMRDSLYTLNLNLEAEACPAASPCKFVINDDAGNTVVISGLMGKPWDTVSVPLSFPSTQFRADTRLVMLTFANSQGTVKGSWIMRLGWGDVSAVKRQMKVRERILGDFMTLPRIDGRVK